MVPWRQKSRNIGGNMDPWFQNIGGNMDPWIWKGGNMNLGQEEIWIGGNVGTHRPSVLKVCTTFWDIIELRAYFKDAVGNFPQLPLYDIIHKLVWNYVNQNTKSHQGCFALPYQNWENRAARYKVCEKAGLKVKEFRLKKHLYHTHPLTFWEAQ